ncbi:MAG: hypothetical protein S4CHLAM45_09870 [Chlamydiales bacterium]|nr:hypothetical protein [Chlamydiales bacterium]MCH9620195.1 hypothetical protein [Chlamydiales bacterium]MCH9623090.1 hypothetical protein [Chlamydiales bacterium]
MKRLSFFFSSLLLGALISYGAFTFASNQFCDSFSVKKIKAPLTFKKAPPLPKEMSSEFHYLGKGSQSYVFESLDGKDVLKFFRMNRYRTPLFSHLPPFLNDIQIKKMELKRKKLQELLKSCSIAHKWLSKECETTYVHLEKSSNLKKKVLIYDALKRPSVINLDDYAFIIQRKATPLYAHLGGLIKKRDPDAVIEALESLKTLLISRFEKGIADHDPVIEKNMGFIGGKALFIDTGQFYLDNQIYNPDTYRVEGEKIVRKLKIWLENQDPYYSQQYLDVLKF